MSPYDIPGAVALIILSLLVWAVVERRSTIRRREQAARDYWLARQAAKATPLCSVRTCGRPGTVAIRGWHLCASDAERFTRRPVAS